MPRDAEFDGTLFLEVARELSEPAEDGPRRLQARWRTAVSRAYYACFWYARDFVEHVLQLPVASTADAHSDVGALFRLRERNDRKLAVVLEQLRAERNLADYNRATQLAADRVATVIRTAGQLLIKLRAIEMRAARGEQLIDPTLP